MEKLRFTDGKGNPISHEAFEMSGFTEGMRLEGQLIVTVKCKTGILTMAARCTTQEDFDNLSKLLYKQYVKENDIK